MNFTSRDMGILVAMTLAVVGISFVFPALGLTGQEADKPPEFNITQQRFDFAAEFPDNPGTPTTGTFNWDPNNTSTSENQIWFHGDTDAGVELVALNGVGETEKGEIRINKWDTGTVTYDTYNVTGEGQQIVHNNFSYEIIFTINEFESQSGDNVQYAGEYEIREQPSDEGWISRIPIVGGAYSSAEALAQIVAWGVSVIWWYATILYQTIGNLMGMVFDVGTFFVTLLAWLTTTYTDVIGAASGFASVFVAIPGMILSLMLAKFTMVAISLLPTT